MELIQLRIKYITCHLIVQNRYFCLLISLIYGKGEEYCNCFFFFCVHCLSVHIAEKHLQDVCVCRQFYTFFLGGVTIHCNWPVIDFFFEIVWNVYYYRHQRGATHIQKIYMSIKLSTRLVNSSIKQRGWPRNKKPKVWNHLILSISRPLASSTPSKAFLFLSSHTTQNMVRGIISTYFLRPVMPLQAQILTLTGPGLTHLILSSP